MSHRIPNYGSFAFNSVDSRLHQHVDFYELIIVTHGVITHTYNEESSTLQRGACLLLKPGTTHRLFCLPMQATHFCLCVQKKFLEKFVHQHFPDIHLETFPDMCQFRVLDECLIYLEKLANVVCQSFSDKTAADTITYLLLNSLFYKVGTNNTNTQYYYIDNIISMLNTPAGLNMTVDELCATVDVSRTTILKNFRLQTEHSIMEYKALRKLSYAAKLLETSDTSVTDIAFSLGYNSLSSFLRSFKKKYGLTPSEYRKKHKN